MKDRPDLSLGVFNREFGMFTFGSYFTPNVLGALGTQASGRQNVLGTRSYQGSGGFPAQFRDSINFYADQIHHFGAYFSAGIAGHKFAADMHRADDRDQGNMGDVRLADQSRRLGDYLRRNPGQLGNIGQLIQDTICNEGSVPK